MAVFRGFCHKIRYVLFTSFFGLFVACLFPHVLFGYTITFTNGNETMWTQDCPDNTTVTLDPVAGMSNMPVSGHGWGFSTWFNVTNGSGSYTDGASNFLCSSNITLRGSWTRTAVQFCYSYLVGGSYNPRCAVTAQGYSNGSLGNVSTRTLGAYDGWEPLGWIIGDPNSTSVSDIGDSVLAAHRIQPSPAADQDMLHYYALYRRNPTVTYNGNGADSGSVSATNCSPEQYYNASGVATTNSECVLASNENGFVKNGYYVFAGWNTAANGTGTTYAAGDTYTVPAMWGTPVLYAKWAQCSCTNGNNSTCGGTPSITNNTCSYDWTCDAGYDDGDGNTSGTVYASGAGVGTVQAPNCLPINLKYTLTVDKNGGTGNVTVRYRTNESTSDNTNNVFSVTGLGDGDIVTMPALGAPDNTLTLTGYGFRQWECFDSNDDRVVLDANNTFVMPSDSVTCTAQWASCECIEGTGVTTGSCAAVLQNNQCVFNWSCQDMYYGAQSITTSTTPYTASCTLCPENYRTGSDFPRTSITDCYGDRNRAWTGGQTSCFNSTYLQANNIDLTNCNVNSSSCNSCSVNPCPYEVYSNATGDGDGTLRGGCATNNDDCQQTIATLVANTGYHANGTVSCDPNVINLIWNDNNSTSGPVSQPTSCIYGTVNGISPIAQPTKTDNLFLGWGISGSQPGP